MSNDSLNFNDILNKDSFIIRLRYYLSIFIIFIILLFIILFIIIGLLIYIIIKLNFNYYIPQ